MPAERNNRTVKNWSWGVSLHTHILRRVRYATWFTFPSRVLDGVHGPVLAHTTSPQASIGFRPALS